jgi:hypothetical protein
MDLDTNLTFLDFCSANLFGYQFDILKFLLSKIIKMPT